MTFGPFSKMLPMFICDDGWKPNTPVDLIEGAGLMPGLRPLWDVFTQLARGRGYTAFGTPLPISYSDLEHGVSRLGDCDPDEARVLLSALDDVYLGIASKMSG